ncbi:MAG: flagellar motor switch protein FliG [Hyphomicrobiales bacterium]
MSQVVTVETELKDASFEELEGKQKAALLMMALGTEHGSRIWEALIDEEIKEISLEMSRMGNINAEVIEHLLIDFISQMSASGALTGSFDATERLLKQFLPGDRVSSILEEIRGPAGRNMWEQLSNVQEDVLANYLKNEYPQTVSVVLSKLRSDQSAKILGLLPDDFALEVVNRMLTMEAVQREILDRIEDTLRIEFMSSLAQTNRRDAHEQMADIFNSFDRQTEARFLTSLEEENRESAERIKHLMFTFEDLGKLDGTGCQTLLRDTPKDKLAIALKGTTDAMRDFFFSNMSQRAAKMLNDDLEVMGPVRLKDVDEAQLHMVNLCKDLAAKGQIVISNDSGADDYI